MTNPQEGMLSLRLGDITAEFIEDLVGQGLSESLTLEYKQDLTDRVLETIAAMANSYGGLILLGVTDKFEIEGVGPEIESKLINKCQSKLEPPVVPDMALIDGVGPKQATVLAIRVDADRMPRPIVLDGKVMVRIQGRNAPADRHRLYSLFAAPPPSVDLPMHPGTSSVLSPSRSYPPSGFGDTPHFIIRSVLRVQKGPHTRVPAIDTALRSDLKDRLADSLLVKWRHEKLRLTDRHQDATWSIVGAQTTSTQVTLTSEAPEGDEEVPTFRAVLNLADALYAGPAIFFIDAVFRRAEETDSPLFGVDELIELCTLILGDVTHAIGIPLLRSIVDTGLWMEGFTDTRMECSKSYFTDWIDLHRFERFPDARSFRETNPLVLSGSSLRDGPFRPHIVNWLKLLLLDLGYSNFEGHLELWRLQQEEGPGQLTTGPPDACRGKAP